MNIFMKLYYWLVNTKDWIIYPNLRGMSTLTQTFIKYGWILPPRKITCRGYTYSYINKDGNTINCLFNLNGWSVKKGKTTMNFSFETDILGGNLWGEEALMDTEKSVEEALIKMDSHFASVIRETKIDLICNDGEK